MPGKYEGTKTTHIQTHIHTDKLRLKLLAVAHFGSDPLKEEKISQTFHLSKYFAILEVSYLHSACACMCVCVSGGLKRMVFRVEKLIQTSAVLVTLLTLTVGMQSSGDSWIPPPTGVAPCHFQGDLVFEEQAAPSRNLILLFFSPPLPTSSSSPGLLIPGP